jgi:uncharacterized protein YjbI with pentapeptide repeats
MSSSSSVERPTPLKPIPTWGILLIILVTVIVTLATYWFFDLLVIPDNFGDNTDPALERTRFQLEALRVALTLGAGIVGATALWLAFRRQIQAEKQHAFHEYQADRAREEFERDFQQRETAQARAEYDALQRRITEMRVQAIAQLGSDNAAVRIGGLHNLERIGEQHPELRQTVLDEICSYLQLPFEFDVDGTEANFPSRKQFEPSGPPPVRPNREVVQEKRVRALAQRILVRHLSKHNYPESFWTHERIDLSGAELSGIDFSGCELVNLNMTGAVLKEVANFTGAVFRGLTLFEHVTFEGEAQFFSSIFETPGIFTEAVFRNVASFDRAKLKMGADFSKAQFEFFSTFTEVFYGSDTSFRYGTFHKRTDFNRSLFVGAPAFDETKFLGGASFGESDLRRGAWFDRCHFMARLIFDSCRTLESLHFNDAIFEDDLDFARTQINGELNFRNSVFRKRIGFFSSQVTGNLELDDTVLEDGISVIESEILGSVAASPKRFDGGIIFMGSRFASSTVFQRVHCQGDVIFHANQFEQVPDLQGLTASLDARFTSLPSGWRFVPSEDGSLRSIAMPKDIDNRDALQHVNPSCENFLYIFKAALRPLARSRRCVLALLRAPAGGGAHEGSPP